MGKLEMNERKKRRNSKKKGKEEEQGGEILKRGREKIEGKEVGNI